MIWCSLFLFQAICGWFCVTFIVFLSFLLILLLPFVFFFFMGTAGLQNSGHSMPARAPTLCEVRVGRRPFWGLSELLTHKERWTTSSVQQGGSLHQASCCPHSLPRKLAGKQAELGIRTPNSGCALLTPYMGLFLGSAEAAVYLQQDPVTLSQGHAGASPQLSQAEQG